MRPLRAFQLKNSVKRRKLLFQATSQEGTSLTSGSVTIKALKLIATSFCLGAFSIAPIAAVADETRPKYELDKGYLWQSGLSLAVIPLTDNDRLQHLAAGSAISAFVTYKTGSFWKGCAASVAAGFLKEVYDDVSNTGRFEARDIGYTLAGCSFTIRF